MKEYLQPDVSIVRLHVAVLTAPSDPDDWETDIVPDDTTGDEWTEGDY